MSKSSKSMKVSKSNKLVTSGVSKENAERIAGGIVDSALARSQGRPEPFSDSFTTEDATFSVEVKDPWGEVTEDIEVKIDCNGAIHGDESLIDLLIEMLENAKDNLAERRGTRFFITAKDRKTVAKVTRKRLGAL